MKSLSLGPDKFSHQQEAVPMPRTMSTGELGTLKIKARFVLPVLFISQIHFKVLTYVGTQKLHNPSTRYVYLLGPV